LQSKISLSGESFHLYAAGALAGALTGGDADEPAV
jgi:hypothetical protein